tara:strand:- start:231 stop:1169 length:939 start_codon:yes stop_codon:yes gene_type:complete
MFDSAQNSIEIASFYISPSEKQDALDPVWESLRKAVDRGVQLRVLVDLSFSDKYPEPLKELETWPNTKLKRIDYNPGVMHAKYFIIDKKEAFLGSQNFDYRALEHIFELGMRIQEEHIVQSLSRIFALDWGEKNSLPKPKTVNDIFVVASPLQSLPSEIPYDLPHILSLIQSARKTLRLQFLSYNNQTRSKESWTILDDALINAIQRGVKVELMVSDWATKGSKGRSLEKLRTNGVIVHVASVPEHSSGHIPFARTVHAKTIISDQSNCWLGTSNASKSYFTTSRNVGLIIHNKKLCLQMDDFFTRILKTQK